MGTSRRVEGIKGVLKRLSDSLGTLPSLDEKKVIVEQLESLVGFLKSLQEEIERLPSKQDVEGLSESLVKLEQAIGHGMENPIWQAVLGQAGRGLSKSGSPVASAQDVEQWKRIISKLESLPIDEIRKCLSDEGSHPLRDLRGIASLLGLTMSTNQRRDSVIEQITRKVSNLRGYKELGEGK